MLNYIPGGGMLKLAMILAVAYLIIMYIAVILTVGVVAVAIWWMWRRRQRQPDQVGAGTSWDNGPYPMHTNGARHAQDL